MIKVLGRVLAPLTLLIPFTATAGDPMVATAQGMVHGAFHDGVHHFYGIPYAAPPVGELRWKAPQDPASWTGVREATAFGSACPQIGGYFGNNDPSTFDKPWGAEDCLYLNVWVPASASSKPRPVLIYIHGGSAVVGAGSLELYSGERLARELDAVVININYRLAFFGILKLEALKTGNKLDDSGSFALLDQIKALDWIQRNAAAFGGDPGRVIVSGESAGCSSIWNLMNSPLARGKFVKTICMSGLPQMASDEDHDAAAKKFLGRLLVADKKIADEQGLDAYLAATKPDALRDYLYARSAYELVNAGRGIAVPRERVDGTVITNGKAGPVLNPVPSILGSMRDEAPLLTLKKFGNVNYYGMWQLIQSGSPTSQLDFFDGYLDFVKFKGASWLLNRALHKKVTEAATLLAGSNVPVYRYMFTWDNMPEPWRSLLGSYHGLDVAFAFGTFELDHPAFTHFTWGASEPAEREAIHSKMVAAFRGFIEADDPNRYDAGLGWKKWADEGDEKQF